VSLSVEDVLVLVTNLEVDGTPCIGVVVAADRQGGNQPIIGRSVGGNARRVAGHLLNEASGRFTWGSSHRDKLGISFKLCRSFRV